MHLRFSVVYNKQVQSLNVRTIDVFFVFTKFLSQEKELERWKHRVKDLESENFIKDQTIRQLQEQAEVRTFVRPQKLLIVNCFPPESKAYFRENLVTYLSSYQCKEKS